MSLESQLGTVDLLRQGRRDLVRCARCVWFESLPSGTAGSCRHQSPRPQPVALISWPAVIASDWCGDFTGGMPRRVESAMVQVLPSIASDSYKTEPATHNDPPTVAA